MDKTELEDLKDEELFDIQNSISEIIKKRNLEKGDTDEVIDFALMLASQSLMELV